jgi:hypothetical protein
VFNDAAMVAGVGAGAIDSGGIFVSGGDTFFLFLLGQPQGFGCFGFEITEKYCLIPPTPMHALAVVALKGFSGAGMFDFLWEEVRL